MRPSPGRPAGGFLAAAVAALISTPAAPAGDVPVSLDEIGAVYQRQQDSIRTYLVEYESKGKALADMSVLNKHLGVRRLTHEETTYAAKGELRFLHRVDKSGQLEESMPGDRTILFDGKVLREKRPLPIDLGSPPAPGTGKGSAPGGGRPPVPKIDQVIVKALRRDNALYFPCRYNSGACVAFPDPGDKPPAAATARHRIPDLFRTAAFTVSPAREVVDGAPCVVVSAPGAHKLWLDPALRYAVRKREVYADGVLQYAVVCRGHELVPGTDLWLPRSVTQFIAAPPTAPPEYRGKFLQQLDMTVRRVEVNKPGHDAVFDLKVRSGSMVADETLASADPTRIPNRGGERSRAVSYTQPANPADLDAVIQQAKENYDKRQSGKSRRRALLWGINIAVVAVVAAFGVRWWARRRATPPGTGATP